MRRESRGLLRRVTDPLNDCGSCGAVFFAHEYVHSSVGFSGGSEKE
jgi:hypothetical protein